MILTCNECDTKFLIKAEALGTGGRRVRCGNCAAMWFVKPPEPEVAATEKAVIREQQENLKEVVKKQAAGEKPSLPAVYEPVAAPKWLKAACAILAIANVGAVIYFNKSMIGQTAFYDMVGQYETKGVEITDAELLLVESKRGNFYQVNWAVINNSDGKRKLPLRRIKVLDKNLAAINSGTGKDDLTLDKGQKAKSDPNKVKNDGKNKYVVLEIGNPYELMRR